MITGGWLDGTTGSVVGAGDDVGGMVVEAAVSGGAGGVATVDEVDGAGDVTVAVVVDVAGTGLSGEAFGWRLLDEEKVAVMPGSSFGHQARNHIRVALSADKEVLREAAARMTALALRLSHGKAA